MALLLLVVVPVLVLLTTDEVVVAVITVAEITLAAIVIEVEVEVEVKVGPVSPLALPEWEPFALEDSRAAAVKVAKRLVRRIIRVCRSNGIAYTDTEFEVGEASAGWERLGRMAESSVRLMLNGCAPSDVVQGSLGTCYLVGSLASLAASHPEAAAAMVVKYDTELGVYGLVLFKNGQWVPVVVDDYVPMVEAGGERWQAYSRCSNPREIWVSLVEKAYAKVHGGYPQIEGGKETSALVDMTAGIPFRVNLRSSKWMAVLFGSPKARSAFRASLSLSASGSIGVLDGDECGGAHEAEGGAASDAPHLLLWAYMRRKLDERYALSAYVAAEQDAAGTVLQDGSGLVTGHAYAVLGCAEICDESAVGVGMLRLVRMRNPWGGHEYTGPYSAVSPMWTPALRRAAGFALGGNGTFFMTYEDFVLHFTGLDLCRVIDDTWFSRSMLGSWSVRSGPRGQPQHNPALHVRVSLTAAAATCEGASAELPSGPRAFFEFSGASDSSLSAVSSDDEARAGSLAYEALLAAPDAMYLVLAQDDARLARGEEVYDISIGFDVLLLPSEEAVATVAADPRQLVTLGKRIHITPFSNTREVVAQISGRELRPEPGATVAHLVVCAYTWRGGTELPFSFRVASRLPVSLSRLELSSPAAAALPPLVTLDLPSPVAGGMLSEEFGRARRAPSLLDLPPALREKWIAAHPTATAMILTKLAVVVVAVAVVVLAVLLFMASSDVDVAEGRGAAALRDGAVAVELASSQVVSAYLTSVLQSPALNSSLPNATLALSETTAASAAIRSKMLSWARMTNAWDQARTALVVIMACVVLGVTTCLCCAAGFNARRVSQCAAVAASWTTLFLCCTLMLHITGALLVSDLCFEMDTSLASSTADRTLFDELVGCRGSFPQLEATTSRALALASADVCETGALVCELAVNVSTSFMPAPCVNSTMRCSNPDSPSDVSVDTAVADYGTGNGTTGCAAAASYPPMLPPSHSYCVRNTPRILLCASVGAGCDSPLTQHYVAPLYAALVTRRLVRLSVVPLVTELTNCTFVGDVLAAARDDVCGTHKPAIHRTMYLLAGVVALVLVEAGLGLAGVRNLVPLAKTRRRATAAAMAGAVGAGAALAGTTAASRRGSLASADGGRQPSDSGPTSSRRRRRSSNAGASGMTPIAPIDSPLKPQHRGVAAAAAASPGLSRPGSLASFVENTRDETSSLGYSYSYDDGSFISYDDEDGGGNDSRLNLASAASHRPAPFLADDDESPPSAGSEPPRKQGSGFSRTAPVGGAARVSALRGTGLASGGLSRTSSRSAGGGLGSGSLSRSGSRSAGGGLGSGGLSRAASRAARGGLGSGGLSRTNSRSAGGALGGRGRSPLARNTSYQMSVGRLDDM
ncbi:uncharacterized protein AMSG_12080 [Thecamonas trahens ATCC 50062]|uniref:Calpain catalytic domain-containing protein n=1 Tax=Thecamonas trahens ATCC 50062 TaxID=461836 RepID=A0A0L0DGY3_THETB|nr:hypothetical protein AMSG_12080 [Thecamonas trahens ATCC 50062]KNC51396.1 hypothetical protein AMSG_12080 [Thecamonas trahens ATCC 50062]|eukprot:XP_013756160.1 hypothetical protein AMSG_12080 [Thecamonas trahens ATCC 50062]